MRGDIQVIGYLNERQTVRLSHDFVQWILEKGRPGRERFRKDSGYRGVSFVCTRTEILLRCIRQHNLMVDLTGRKWLAGLHADYPTFRSHVEASGIDEVRSAIERQASTCLPVSDVFTRPREAIFERRQWLGLHTDYSLRPFRHRGVGTGDLCLTEIQGTSAGPESLDDPRMRHWEPEERNAA